MKASQSLIWCGRAAAVVLFALLWSFAMNAHSGVAATHQASHTAYVEAMAQAKADYKEARAACTKREGKTRNDCLTVAKADNRKAVQEAKAKHSAALAAGH